MSTQTKGPSTVLLKIVMAVTGAVYIGFVAQHMVAHLLMFGGPDVYNGYAHSMQSAHLLKWTARLGLLGALAAHVVSAIMLIGRNKAARPVAYQSLESSVTTVSAKSMRLTGFAILAYLIYHILHFTVGTVHSDHFDTFDANGHRDVYRNFVLSFRNPVIFGAYVVATLAVTSHISHALQSMLRTLGVANTPALRQKLAQGSFAFATVLWIGYMLPPVASMAGFLTLEGN